MDMTLNCPRWVGLGRASIWCTAELSFFGPSKSRLSHAIREKHNSHRDTFCALLASPLSLVSFIIVSCSSTWVLGPSCFSSLSPVSTSKLWIASADYDSNDRTEPGQHQVPHS